MGSRSLNPVIGTILASEPVVLNHVDCGSHFPPHGGADLLEAVLGLGVFRGLGHDRFDRPTARYEATALLEVLAAKYFHAILLVQGITD